MDTLTIIAFAVAVTAVVVATFILSRSRRLAATIDEATTTIGGTSPRRRWRRREALSEALQRLERASAQAQKERSQLAGALQAASTGIVITDDHGGVVFANPAADQFLGARHGEAVAEVRLRDTINQAILNRTTVAAEAELYTPVRRMLEISAVPLDFGVESVGAVAYIRDTTEQQRVEAMRRDFIANVSHELKTPLAALAVLAETIAQNAAEPEITSRMATRLESEANRLSALIDDILDLSQAEALAAHDQPLQVTSLVAAVLRDAQPRADSAGIRIVAEPPPAGTKVSGDQRQLKTMLSNLLDNAIKYSEPSAAHPQPRVWLSVSEDDAGVSFEVRDEGIGIPDGHVDRIFERFYRVDRARSRATGGTGLGLSIVRNIARSHGGEVSVESIHGEGSTFTVTLPKWVG